MSMINYNYDLFLPQEKIYWKTPQGYDSYWQGTVQEHVVFDYCFDQETMKHFSEMELIIVRGEIGNMVFCKYDVIVNSMSTYIMMVENNKYINYSEEKLPFTVSPDWFIQMRKKYPICRNNDVVLTKYPNIPKIVILHVVP